MLRSRIKKKRKKISKTAQNERKCAKKHSLERIEMELSLFYFDGAIANLSMLSFPQNRRGVSPILRTKVKTTNPRDTPGRATDLGK